MSNKHPKCEAGRGGFTVAVRGNDEKSVDKAIKKLKKLIINEGFLKELKDRMEYEKPSDKRRKNRKEAIRRQQKAISLRLRHEGF